MCEPTVETRVADVANTKHPHADHEITFTSQLLIPKCENVLPRKGAAHVRARVIIIIIEEGHQYAFEIVPTIGTANF